MALLLHVEFDASSESVATKMLDLLNRMAEIVHRDHAEVYSYLFRSDTQSKTKLIFTELYGNEQVFLDHASDAEFSKLYRQAFNDIAGRSRQELCIRDDIHKPLLPITANILDHYLHVTYIPVQQGFLYRNVVEKSGEQILIVCTGCDENVYQQLNTLVDCITCVTFEIPDQGRGLIAVVGNIVTDKIAIKDAQPSINTVELVCSNEESIQQFKSMMNQNFQIRSFHIQTSFSGYIQHKS
jgi:quinol monooxygenase YgiN